MNPEIFPGVSKISKKWSVPFCQIKWTFNSFLKGKISDLFFFQSSGIADFGVIVLWNVVGVGLAVAGFFGIGTKRPLFLFTHFALLILIMLLIKEFSKCIPKIT